MKLVLFSGLVVFSAEALSVSRVLKKAPQYGSAIRTVQKEVRKLQKELTEEQATALDTYNSDRCRIENDAKDNTQLKTESEAKIAELNSYMGSVGQGQIEFTNEREENEKAVADTSMQVNELTNLIQKTDDEFQQAEAALSDQVAALNEAKSILTATVAGGGGAAALLARPKLSLAEQRTQTKKKNVALTNLLLKVHRLSAQDRDAIRSLITVGDDEVPRSATGSLIGVVDKLLTNTDDTLHEQREEYQLTSTGQKQTLMNLDQQLAAAQAALSDAAAENAARAAAMEESQIAHDAAKKNLEQAEFRLERAAADKMDLDKAFEMADEIRGQDLKNIHKATEIINKFMQGDDEEKAAAFLQLSLRKQGDGPTVVDSLNLLIERGSELIDDKEGIKDELKAQVEACQKSLKEFSSSASAASMAWDTSEDNIRDSKAAIEHAEHNIADEEKTIEELTVKVNKTTVANDERLAEHEESVRKVRVEHAELKELKTALSEDNSEALMPVITLVANMISRMDGEVQILMDADEKAEKEFQDEITSLNQSIADSNEAVVNLNSAVAAQQQKISENRHIAGGQQDITEDSAESYRQMRQDCTRVEGAPDLLATLEHEIQGLHRALDALRVITNGA